MLIKRLSTYGAYKAVCDAARVLRLVGTKNSKNGAQVEYWRIGDRIQPRQLSLPLQAYQNSLKPAQKLADGPKPRKCPATSTLKMWYSLSYCRMQDMRRLAELRGPLKTLRWAFLYCYAVEAARFCKNLTVKVVKIGSEPLDQPCNADALGLSAKLHQNVRWLHVVTKYFV